MTVEKIQLTAMIVEGKTQYFADEKQTAQHDAGPTFRDIIKAAIDSAAGDAEKASIAVCLVLEDELDLSGRGFFDNDTAMHKAFADAADLSTPTD